jgi:uncharacterized membrane protein
MALVLESLVVVGLLAFAVYLVVVLPPANPFRLIATLVVVLLLPGYALLTLLFPARERDSDMTGNSRASLGWIERVALSFGLSLALVPLFGFVFSATGMPLRARPILTLVGGVTVVAFVLGFVRRLRLPSEERYALPLATSFTRYRSWLTGGTATDAALNIALSLAIIVAVSGLAFGFALPARESSYTQVSLLQVTDDGGLVAADYNTTFTRGESTEYVVEVANQENEPVQYTVVVQQQTLVEREGGEMVTVATSTVTQFQGEVGHGQTWRIRHRFSPDVSGERTRLVYLVYRGSPPANPSVESAYRYLVLWYDLE